MRVENVVGAGIGRRLRKHQHEARCVVARLDAVDRCWQRFIDARLNGRIALVKPAHALQLSAVANAEHPTVAGMNDQPAIEIKPRMLRNDVAHSFVGNVVAIDRTQVATVSAGNQQGLIVIIKRKRSHAVGVAC